MILKNKGDNNISKNLNENLNENLDENFNKKDIEKEISSQKEKKILKKRILKVEEEFYKIKDAFLRARAEVQNSKRRSEKEMEKIHKYSLYKFAKSLLPIKDSLESSLNLNLSSIEIIRNGINLTLKQLSSIFEQNNFIEIFPDVGEILDPMKHQAISIVYSKQNDNTIAKVLQCGYMLYDRLLRPALVIVSKKK